MGKGIPMKNPKVPIRAKVRSQRKKAGLPGKIERIRGYIKADAKRRPPRKAAIEPQGETASQPRRHKERENH
jgi:hypothetical protein